MAHLCLGLDPKRNLLLHRYSHWNMSFVRTPCDHCGKTPDCLYSYVWHAPDILGINATHTSDPKYCNLPCANAAQNGRFKYHRG